MATRVIVGLFLAIFLYAAISFFSPLGFFILFTIMLAAVQIEFYQLHFESGFSPLPMIGLFSGLLVLSSFYFGNPFYEKGLVTNIVFSVMLFAAFHQKPSETTLNDLAITFLGIFYISWLLGHILLVRGLVNGRFLLFFLFLVTYSSDTGAYFAGKAFGGKKLCPSISPNKTWSGAVGGLFCSAAMAVIANRLLGNLFSVENVLYLGMLLGITGPIGDLVESVLKRSTGTKDSGAIIPGHGGLLDRVDSLIFTAPVYYYYIMIFSINVSDQISI